MYLNIFISNITSFMFNKLYILHNFIGMDDDSDALLDLALSVAEQRVVVKRSRIAPYLSNLKPSYTLEGKSNRFDIYLV